MSPVCPFLWMSDPQKAFSFRGLGPLTRGSAPGRRWDLRPQTPAVIGSRSELAMVRPLQFFLSKFTPMHNIIINIRK